MVGGGGKRVPQGGLASAAAPFGARYERHFYIRKYYNKEHLHVHVERGAGYEFFAPCAMQIQGYHFVLVYRRSLALNCFLKI